MQHQIPVTKVEEISGYPAVLEGRVKTLHPMIHAAILSKQTPDHLDDLRELGVEPIQLVVVNLYPFVGEVLEKNLSPDDAVEYIDIGGPTLLRGAAKNYANVVALFNPDQYDEFLGHLTTNRGRIPEDYRKMRAREIFFYTSWYDGQIESYFGKPDGTQSILPQFKTFHIHKVDELRYGENPHQQAALYQIFGDGSRGLSNMEQLCGKQLSFNNYVDVNAAYCLALEFPEAAVAIIKHTNPCGAAVSYAGVADAFDKALRGDSLSAFGGIVACNQPVDAESAEKMSKIFFECIIAPDFENSALEILQKKKNLRLLKLSSEQLSGEETEIKYLSGTFLLQQADHLEEDPRNWEIVTCKRPGDEEWQELIFAWKVAKHVKSNAIVLSKDLELYGVGAGQMSRVDSVNIARMKAQQANREFHGLVLASDAFFPFRDGIDEAAKSGVTAVIQPGGSIRDEEVIEAANEYNISMVFTKVRHFKH
jgi:phosphoribosylaminoimidazolecarboxamide formyltransferase/IMP cyclohydrolase